MGVRPYWFIRGFGEVSEVILTVSHLFLPLFLHQTRLKPKVKPGLNPVEKPLRVLFLTFLTFPGLCGACSSALSVPGL